MITDGEQDGFELVENQQPLPHDDADGEQQDQAGTSGTAVLEEDQDGGDRCAPIGTQLPTAHRPPSDPFSYGSFSDDYQGSEYLGSDILSDEGFSDDDFGEDSDWEDVDEDDDSVYSIPTVGNDASVAFLNHPNSDFGACTHSRNS